MRMINIDGSITSDSMNLEGDLDDKITPYTDTRPLSNSSGGVDQDSCNIIIVNLADGVTENEIRDLFGSVGEIVTCKLVKNRETNQNQGYGFVLFRDPDAAEHAVIKFNGHHLGGKYLKVDYASKKKKLASGNDKNLYVAGLPAETDEESLKNFFERFGKVNNVALLKSTSDSGRRVGFVMYADVKDAETAIEQMNGKCLPGSSITLTVKFAIAKDNKANDIDSRRRVAPMKNISSGKPDLTSKFLAGGVLGNSMLSDTFGLSSLNPVANQLASLTGNQLGNQLNALQSNSLGALTGQNNQLASPMNGIENSIQNLLNSASMNGSNSIENLLTPLLASQVSTPSNGGPAVVNGVAVLPGSGHNSLITGEVTTVFVQGLPPDCDSLMLYELFSPFGGVLNVKPVVDKWDTKYCKGFAFINFRKQDAARHAIIAMNGYSFKGNTLQVVLKPDGLDYSMVANDNNQLQSGYGSMQHMQHSPPSQQRGYSNKYGF